MATVGIRDLKNNLSAYLKRLKPGHVLMVTDRGRVVAELRAPVSVGRDSGLTGRYDALIAAGVIRGPREHGDPMADWPTNAELKLAAGTARALIDADRGT